MKIRLGRLLIAWRCCPSKPVPTPPSPPVPTPPPPTPPVQGQHLTLTVQSSSVSQSEIDTYLTQQNAQLTNEFTAAWGIAAYIDTQPGGWPVYLLDNSDVAGALGYHDYNGSPFANIFVQTAKQAGVSWQSVASHEVLEMLADPGPTFKTATAPNGDVWDYEICDPVESDLDGSMSDFVFPNFFTVSNGPWDQDKVLAGPFTIAPGGYAVVNGQTVLGQMGPVCKHVDDTYRKRIRPEKS